MRIKLFFGGEAITIPKTDFGLAYALVSVWIDGNGFTSAANAIGTIGYVCLETEEVDLGDVDAATQQTFANLHATVVHYDITTNLFVKDGGIATITMTVSVQTGGQLTDRKLQFQASACRGVSVLTSPISFSVEMLQQASPVALLDDGTILSDDVAVALGSQSPSADATQADPATGGDVAAAQTGVA
ncbi:hypothetical protein [Lichenicola sp.]|uniref:hypothetical protein n=1 Tax=Lichenicola sp. TaxID=2804529 RepID=UPI003B007841